MKLLYTGASQANEEQKDPSKSLGGYVSLSPVPNGVLQSIFPAASLLSTQQKKKEVRLIALHNESTIIASNLTLTFKLDEDAVCDYKLAIVAPNLDTCNDPLFERIDSGNSLPYYAEFNTIVNNEPIELSDLNANSYFGIWLMREYNETATEVKSCSTIQEEFDQPEPVEISKEEILEMKISWDIEQSQSASQSNSNSNSLSSFV